jgi:hypothetical protein
MLVASQFPEEGNVVFPVSMNGTATFEVAVPCRSDTWHVWVRGYDNGTQDSFRAQVDGEPAGPMVFEIDCQGGGVSQYLWRQLNQRDPADPPCEYVQDPWVQAWSSGSHMVTFLPRENSAIARVLVTNDTLYVPTDQD